MEYIVNEREDDKGFHEVHNLNCNYLPSEWNQKPLGDFAGCHSAVQVAKQQNPSWTIDGCKHCSPSCHHG